MYLSLDMSDKFACHCFFHVFWVNLQKQNEVRIRSICSTWCNFFNCFPHSPEMYTLSQKDSSLHIYNTAFHKQGNFQQYVIHQRICNFVFFSLSFMPVLAFVTASTEIHVFPFEFSQPRWCLLVSAAWHMSVAFCKVRSLSLKQSCSNLVVFHSQLSYDSWSNCDIVSQTHRFLPWF